MCHLVNGDTKGLEWLTQKDGEKVILSGDIPHPEKLSEATAITILVHAFRGTDAKVQRYYSEISKWLVESDPTGAVIIFDWPEHGAAVRDPVGL